MATSRFTNIKSKFKAMFTGNPIRRIGSIWKYRSSLPDYPTADSKDTYYRIWKDVAPVRANVRARVNSSTANGYVIKTIKKRDIEASNKRVLEVETDFKNPRNKIKSTIRSFVQSLCVYHTAVLETKPKAEGGFIYSLDYRFCDFELNEAGTFIEKVLYRPAGIGEPIVYNRGEFVIATMDSFGDGTDGISQLEASRTEANLYKAVMNYNINQFLSGGMPQLAFILKNGGWDEYARMSEKLKDFSTDSNVALKGDIGIEKLSQAMKDMEYKNLIDAVYDSIMAVSQTPPIMMAQGGGSQGETNRQEMNAFGAEISGIQGIVEEAWAEAIFNTYVYNDIFMKLNPWVDKRQEAVVDRSDMNTGIVTINELRAKRDLAPVDWGDQPYVANYLPEILGERPWIQQAPEPAVPDEEEKPGEEEEEDSEDRPDDPNQNEGNTGEEKPAGQNRDDEEKSIQDQLSELLKIYEQEVKIFDGKRSSVSINFGNPDSQGDESEIEEQKEVEEKSLESDDRQHDSDNESLEEEEVIENPSDSSPDAEDEQFQDTTEQ
jgi:hypothetical protein